MNHHIKPSSNDPWANSSNYMRDNFPHSPFTDFALGGHLVGTSPANKQTAAGGARSSISTWQGGVVVDPADPSLRLDGHFCAVLAVADMLTVCLIYLLRLDGHFVTCMLWQTC